MGRRGPYPARYPLRETPSADPVERTEWNVWDSDATLLLISGGASPGTNLTREIARRLGRPVFSRPVHAAEDVGLFRRWLQVHAVQTLNVTGPRESKAPGSYDQARRILRAYLGGENPFVALPPV